MCCLSSRHDFSLFMVASVVLEKGFLLQSTHHPPPFLMSTLSCDRVLPNENISLAAPYFFFLNPLWLWLPCPAVCCAAFTSHYLMREGQPLHFLSCALCTNQSASYVPACTTPKKIIPNYFLKRDSCYSSPPPLCGCILFPSKVYCVWHIRIYLSLDKKQCYTTYMVLFLHFRQYTERKAPLLRNHSICSGPQRFSPVLIILNSTLLAFRVSI